MQKIIQITIGGRVIPIEEFAYASLNNYISSLEMQFAGEVGRDEIILDIEARIAELFASKLETGAQAIVQSDVQKVIETLGSASDLNDHTQQDSTMPPPPNTGYVPPHSTNTRRLYRNPNDKMLGGVCSGIANYFDIDTVLVRLVFAIMFFTAGIGLLGYILAWIIIPMPRTPQEMQQMRGAAPMDFQTIKKNMGTELQDLKKKGEEMSNELKEFFSNKNKNY